MSNYFDNQNKWSWEIDGEKVIVTTEHAQPKPHSHTMDVTNVSIGEMADNPGKVMGEAHRSVTHDYKDGSEKVTPNSNSSNGKNAVNKGSKDHKAFVNSLHPSNYGKGNEQVNNNVKAAKNSHSKREDGGRERGDEGPKNEGREPSQKGGDKSNNNVANMRASMKANTNGKSNSSISHANGDHSTGIYGGKNAGNGGHGGPSSGKGAQGSVGAGKAGHGGMGTGGLSGSGGIGTGSGGHGGGSATGGHGGGSATGGHGGSSGSGGHGGGGSGSGGHGGH